MDLAISHKLSKSCSGSIFFRAESYGEASLKASFFKGFSSHSPLLAKEVCWADVGCRKKNESSYLMPQGYLGWQRQFGKEVESGIYFCVLKSAGAMDIRKMLLIK
jgi:hypothetical protein